MVLRVVVKGRDNYWRFTLYSWVLEVKDLLEKELGENLEVSIEDSDSEDPELYINGYFVGKGIPGEEGYLIEIVKKAYKLMRSEQYVEQNQHVVNEPLDLETQSPINQTQGISKRTEGETQIREQRGELIAN